MNYTIIHKGEVFYTNWFDAENNHVDGMVVINNYTHKFTVDGATWNEIQEDNL